MSDVRMIDKKSGTWVTNTSEFPLADHGRHAANPGSELIVIAPGQPTKIDLNDYLRGQPTLVRMTEDPVTGEPIAPEVVAEPVEGAPADGGEGGEAAPVVSTGKKK